MIGLKSIAMMLSAFIMLLPALSFAGSVDLPKTGQTTCYDADENVIDCTETGQDGDIQAGVEWPEPRFEDNGDGTVTDHLTGLIWLKNANCGGTMTWNQALTYCNDLASGLCGLTDGSVAGNWRLPNIVELESLVNTEKSGPAAWLNSQGFSNDQASDYWSATAHAGFTNFVWGVDMDDGHVFDYNKSSNYYVWPVRAEH